MMKNNHTKQNLMNPQTHTQAHTLKFVYFYRVANAHVGRNPLIFVKKVTKFNATLLKNRSLIIDNLFLEKKSINIFKERKDFFHVLFCTNLWFEMRN